MNAVAVRTQVVLIDFENVQPQLLPALQAPHVHLRIFIGPQQSKLSADVVMAVQAMGGRAQFIRVLKPGKEALDLHLAYYLGLLTCEFSGAFFHVISKDQGFVSLVEHLNQAGAQARLSPSLLHLQAAPTAAFHEIPRDVTGRVDFARRWLHERTAARPASEATLRSSLEKATFQNQLAPDEVQDVLQALLRSGYIVLDGKKVIYQKALNA